MKNINFKKVLIIIASIIALLLLLTILTIAWAIYTDEPPQFFPLDNPKGVYQITKGCPQAQGWEENGLTSGKAFCVAYKGPGVLLDAESGNNHFFSITVGKSKVDLTQYLGKEIKGIRGKWSNSSEQCIKGACIEINGPFVVLDIDDVIE